MFNTIEFQEKQCTKCNKAMIVSMFGVYYCGTVRCEYPKLYKKSEL